MSSAAVVGAGWHDTYFRWDISTPQRVVSRLEQLPGQGSLAQPGKKLYAERDRFGKWQHLLGSENVLLSYTVHTPKHGIIRRLEVQAHLGDSGEDDLCAPTIFEPRWKKLQLFMAMVGVLPPEDPACVRVDAAVDVGYGDTREGQRVLEALRFARWPGQWYAEWQGPPPTRPSRSRRAGTPLGGCTAGTRSSGTVEHDGANCDSRASTDSPGARRDPSKICALRRQQPCSGGRSSAKGKPRAR